MRGAPVNFAETYMKTFKKLGDTNQQRANQTFKKNLLESFHYFLESLQNLLVGMFPQTLGWEVSINFWEFYKKKPF